MKIQNRNQWTWPLALFAITFCAFALRWHYVNVTYVYAPLSGDASQYYFYAWNLAHHGIFSLTLPGTSAVTPDNYRDPAYPLFLALCMKVFASGQAWYVAAMLCQALLGGLTAGVSVQIVRQWLPPCWAIGAGVLMAAWPHNIAITGFVLTETLFGFLCSLGMLLWILACRWKRHDFALAGGLVLGLAALTNAVLQPFGFLLAVIVAWRTPSLRKICLTLALASAVLPCAWGIRNMHVSSGDIHTSSRGRALQNLVQGSWPAYHFAWRLSKLGDDKAKTQAKAVLDDMNKEYELLVASPLDGTKAIAKRLGQHPLAYLSWYLIEKPRELWGWDIAIGQGDIYPYPVANSPFQTNKAWIALEAICHTINPLLLLLAVACPLLGWWIPSAERQLQMNIICMLAYVTLVYVLLQAEPRYSIPFRSLEIALAFTTLANLTGRWKSYKGRGTTANA